MDKIKTLKTIGMATAAIPVLAACNADKAEQQRPNIIVILTDDMGYSDIGCYGGEVETPNIDKLAENGIRWAQFYNNARSCPSRAVLMTGLYPHQAGMGWMAAADMQQPEYQGYLNNSCVTLGEVMGSAGYETYMVGKWHLCSERQCEGTVTEFWPTSRGFQHFYGIPEGASHYFHARMVVDDVRQPVTGDDFYITDALSDNAVNYVNDHDFSEKPLFMYLAYNAPHWPLHAWPEDIAKYVERYKVGWDVLREERFARQKAMGLFAEDVELSPRDPVIPAWDSLTPEQQEEFTMRMAIYAAQIDAVDKGIGRLVDALEKAGQLENTVIMFMDDNGACAEHQSSGQSKAVTGQADTYESYRINWANLSSTPYREYKHYTNEGGIATPLIVHWPAGIDSSLNGSFCREYGYFADIMATCVELGNAKYPKTYKGNKITPCEGVSLVPNLKGGRTDRGMTFWEHEVNIAVRDGNWKLNIHHVEDEPIDLVNKVELYDMDKDPTELHNLAAEMPDKVKYLFDAWDSWAKRVHAYPLSTDGYGKRQQNYRRHINGDFRDNLGGWIQNPGETQNVKYSIDTENVITGPKTARVDVIRTGEYPLNSFLRWNFPNVDPVSTSMGVRFTYKASCPNKVRVRLTTQQPSEKMNLDELVELKPEGGTLTFDNIDIRADRYQFVLCFGESDPGTIWFDDIELFFNN